MVSKKHIKTGLGIYKYQPIPLYRGRKPLDFENAAKNLIDTAKIFDEAGLQWGIIYGTLLGAVRNGNFIEYDEDVDVFVLDEDRLKILNLLFSLRQIDLEVVRYDSDILSIMRNDDYIDIYFFKKTLFGSRRCGDDVLPGKFLAETDFVQFLGKRFPAPKNTIKFLEYAYGKDWKVPIRNKPAEVRGCFARLRTLLRPYSPNFVINFSQHLKRLKSSRNKK